MKSEVRYTLVQHPIELRTAFAFDRLAEMKEQGVPVIRLGDGNPKGRLIEETFLKCMWEVEG